MEDAVYARRMEDLARWSSVAAEAGVDRAHMTLAPGSDRLQRSENLARHVDRLNHIAAVLSDHGLELGLEYVGPREVRARLRYAFIHTLPELLELLRAVDPHVGVVLDSFHWYTAGDSVADILALSGEDVISAEISDGVAGVPRDEQEDLSRALPGTTGVIDITGFLQALARIGFAGPVRVEPFCKDLDGKSDEEILTATKMSLAALLPDRVRQQ
jgi:sugar phosphate isomerase/epimerase